MKMFVVADGRDRLMEATLPERCACRKLVLAELQERYRAQLERAGFFRRRILKGRMHREAEEMVCQRLGLPSREAMFFSTPLRLG